MQIRFHFGFQNQLPKSIGAEQEGITLFQRLFSLDDSGAEIVILPQGPEQAMSVLVKAYILRFDFTGIGQRLGNTMIFGLIDDPATLEMIEAAVSGMPPQGGFRISQ